jgi:ABC-2 type transport system ATP-binding protein
MDNTLLVSLDNPEEQNPALIERMVAAGGAIQFVNEVRHSLEEIYFTLLEEEGGGTRS